MPLRRLSPGIEQPADLELITEDDPLARELANVDALVEQSQRLLDRVSEAKRGSRQELFVGDLVVLRDVEDLPPTLGAALIRGGWESLDRERVVSRLGHYLGDAIHDCVVELPASHRAAATVRNAPRSRSRDSVASPISGSSSTSRMRTSPSPQADTSPNPDIYAYTWAQYQAAGVGGRKNQELVTAGPYARMRNPLYFFSTLGLAGIGLMFGSLFLSLLLFGLSYAVFTYVVAKEEATLEVFFGPEYRDYRDAVPQFFPRLFELPAGMRDGTVEFRPSALRRTAIDASYFLLAIPAVNIIDRVQESEIIQPLFVIY